MEPLEILVDSINREAALNSDRPDDHPWAHRRRAGQQARRAGHDEASTPRSLDVCDRIADRDRRAWHAPGTTMLHRLIAAGPGDTLAHVVGGDQSRAALRTHRSRAKGRDPRFAQAANAAKGLKYMSPGFFAIHPAEPDAPEEEVILLEQAFLTTTPEAMMNVPTYSKWLRDAGSRARRTRPSSCMMQYLQWQRPGQTPRFAGC